MVAIIEKYSTIWETAESCTYFFLRNHFFSYKFCFVFEISSCIFDWWIVFEINKELFRLFLFSTAFCFQLLKRLLRIHIWKKLLIYINDNTALKLLQCYFYSDWVIENDFIFIFRERMGMSLGSCHFQKIANGKETAANLVTEALIKALKLQLLVVILPKKSPLYGRYFWTYPSKTKKIMSCFSDSKKEDYIRQIMDGCWYEKSTFWNCVNR